MSSFCERLKAARTALGLTQEQFAQFGGVKMQAQSMYETGKRVPDADYLVSIVATGADILYILTGERSSSPMPLPAAGELPLHLRKRLKDAIEAVEAGLDALDRHASPAIKAELILTAYDILAQEGEQATAQIIRLIKAA